MAPEQGAPLEPSLACGRVIGLPVAVGDMARVSRAVLDLAKRGAGGHVCVANVHMLTTARGDPDLRAVLERAALVVSDGKPLVWRLRRLGFREAQQVRGPELMLKVCEEAAAEAVPVYFYGGDAPLIDALEAELKRRFPGLRIAGAEAAPILPARPEVDPAALERIRRSGARIVFVALGCPKQEFWMGAYASHLDAVLLGVGQAFAIAAGQLREAPGWLRGLGFEWLFRLVLEPRRLWRRYLVTNSLFLAYLIGDSWTRWFRPDEPGAPASGLRSGR
jgi:N-acetylglucosaminyldiphosphoundecaprenol N-acetyl-beta-D-mannosaminyltransferase